MTPSSDVYVVQIEVDRGEYDYVRVDKVWGADSPLLFFENVCEAEREASKWNTGQVMHYGYRPDNCRENHRRPSGSITRASVTFRQ